MTRRSGWGEKNVELPQEPAHKQRRIPPKPDREARKTEFTSGNLGKTIPTGLITWWDSVAEQTFDYTPAEVVGQSIFVLAPNDRHDEVQWIMERTASGKAIDGMETVRLRKGGQPIKVWMSFAPVLGVAGKVVGDTARVRALSEEEPGRILEQFQTYRKLLGRAPFGVLYFDLDGKLEYANAAIAALLGYSSSEPLFHLNLKNQLFHDSGSFEDFIRFTSRDALKKGLRSERIEWLTRDGTPVQIQSESGIFLNEEGKAAGCAVFFDGRRERDFVERRADQGQKMEALGQLASGVAHEFNNVLGVILGYAQLLQHGSTEEKQRSNLAQIFRAGNQAKLLTTKLQAFGRTKIVEAHLLELNARIASLSEVLRPTLNPGIELVTHLASSPCSINANAAHIDQVLIDLAGNAQDSMPEGGRILFETVLVGRSAVPQPLPPGSYVRLAVSDTGQGMGREELTHIFEPFFFPAEGKRRTNGLELATVYGMVKQNGGFILVDSKAGRGTTFNMYFPQAA